MSETDSEAGREATERQLGRHILDLLREPSARALGKANGAVGGVNLVAILGMLVYQVVVVPTKTELSAVRLEVQAVRDTSASKLDLERLDRSAKQDRDLIRDQMKELKAELRDVSRVEVPSWIVDRVQLLEQDVRTLRASESGGAGGKK